MKFTTLLKSAAVCAAIVSSPAFAQLTFVDGSFTLTTTADANSRRDLLAVSGQALSGSTSTFQETLTADLDTVSNPDTFHSGFSVTQAATTVVTNGTFVSTAKATGSGFIEQRAGTVQIRNLELDLQNTAVYADIYTRQGAFLHQLLFVAGSGTLLDANNTSFSTQTLGTPGVISPTLEADGYYHARGSIINMILDGDYNKNTRATTGALHIINTGWGLPTNGIAGSVMSHAPYVTVDVDLRFAVPEPSTYALMLAGIACLAVTARKRQ